MPEVFTATALFAVLGSAWIMQGAGLSAGLGAFIAGVLLADSEFRHELESQIQDRKSVVSGKSVSVRVDLGGRRIIKKKKKKTIPDLGLNVTITKNQNDQ